MIWGIIGVATATILGSILCHEDYSDHSDYSEYSDADMVSEITKAERKRNNLKCKLKQAESDLREKYSIELRKLKEKYGEDLPDGEIDKIELISKMRNDLQKDIDNAQGQINDINEIIKKINEIQLGEK